MNDDLMGKPQIACFSIEILDSRLNNVSLFRLLLLFPNEGPDGRTVYYYSVWQEQVGTKRIQQP